ncbi:MAG: protein translocase subunit SecD [Bacillota bacterium]
MSEYLGTIAIATGSMLLLVLYAVILRRLNMRSRARLILVTFLAGVVGGGYYLTAVRSLPSMLNLGLDLKGGVDIVLQAEDTPDAPVTDEAMYAAVQIIKQRVDLLGLVEPTVQRVGGALGQERIIVQIPGVTDPEKAIETIGRTAVLRFMDLDGEVSVTGKELVKADVGMRGTEPVVTLEFSPEGASKFHAATEKNYGSVIMILLDEEVISAPVVNAIISDGRAEITGYASVQDAWHLAVMLKSGAMPIKLNVVENRTVSATLGEDSINRSLRAGMIGVIAVLAYMLALYRLPGLVADLTLLLYVMLLLAALVGLNATLTLPGIAGLILSIGMAVDANVIIFERIKEELKTGRTLRAAVDSGFSQALRAILDANITTLIAAGVLFWLGTDRIRGFAVTLSVGIGVSMFTAIVVTKFVLRHLINSGLFKNPRVYFGV